MAPSYLRLSRRERQIMDIIYKRGQATVGEIMKALPDPPSNSAVRSKLRVLEEKGYVSHVYHGPRYVYQPVVPRQKAEKSVLSHLLQTFFDGSVEKAVAALLHLRKAKISKAELDRLSKLMTKPERNYEPYPSLGWMA